MIRNEDQWSVFMLVNDKKTNSFIYLFIYFIGKKINMLLFLLLLRVIYSVLEEFNQIYIVNIV